MTPGKHAFACLAAHKVESMFVRVANVIAPASGHYYRMTRPLTASRLLLVADRRDSPSELRAAPVRRYRLARLRLEGRGYVVRHDRVKPASG